MVEGKYLSEALTYTEIVRGRLNMVVAATGQGKTTMATETLPQKLNITNKARVLYLIDTNMGRDMLARKDILQTEFPPQENKIIVMTYAKFGALLKTYKIWSSMFDLIVADEFHNLYKYAQIDMARMVKANPDFSFETLSMMLSRESASYKAMEALKRWSQSSSLYVVAMTATPEAFIEKDKELNELIQVIQSKEKLIAYEILARFVYTNAEEVLVDKALEGEKRLIFTHTIKQANEFKQLVEDNTERKALALWSNSNLNAPPLSIEQINAREYIIENESFPDDLDDLIFTEAFSTGWNLVDDRVTTTIVHSGNDTLIKQVCGRNRQDVQKLYVYNKESAEKKKERENKKKKELSVNWEIPVAYLNKELNTEERNKLIEEIGYPKKWTSFKKWIENTDRYELKKKRIKGADYFIINEGEKIGGGIV